MIKLKEKRGVKGPIVAPDGSGKVLFGHVAGGSIVDLQDKSLENYLVSHECAERVEKGAKAFYAPGTEHYPNGGAPGNPEPEKPAKTKKD